MRKLLLLSLWALFIPLQANAQQLVKAKVIKKVTSEQVSFYGLNGQQAEVMYRIQEQRLNNLAEIESLKPGDYEQYLLKKCAVRLYTEASIQRMLGPAQKEVYNKKIAEQERQKSALLRQLKMEGAETSERQRAILELEASW